MRSVIHLSRISCCLVVVLFAVGCGEPAADTPELIKAFGTITLDGQPLKDAQVLFTAPNQAPNSGRTDEKGYYVIQYNDETEGAFPGTNEVRINIGVSFSEDPDEDDEDENETGSGTPNLPAKYNSMTTLSADVIEGGAPFDFDLESK